MLVVLWVKVRQKGFHRKLTALQRSVPLGITGIINTTSGTALNRLLILQPLDRFIQSTAVRATHRLIRLDLWGNNGCREYRTLEELLGVLDPVLTMPFDFRIPIHMFGRRYEVTLKHSENWDVPEECMAGYTEEQGSGAVVYLSNKNVFPLGQYGTVFQAEVYAT